MRLRVEVSNLTNVVTIESKEKNVCQLAANVVTISKLVRRCSHYLTM